MLLSGIFTLVAFMSYGQITSVTSGNWSDASTWSGGVPTATDDVVIAAGHNVKMNTNANASSITVNGILEYERILGGPSLTFNITNDINIAASGTFQTKLGNTIHKIYLGGNILNDGVLDLSSNDGGTGFDKTGAELIFTGNNSVSVSGSGTVTDFFTINLQKSSILNEVEFSVRNYSVRSGLAGYNRGFVHLPVNGTLKLSGTSGISTYLFTNSNYYVEHNPVLGNNGKIWLNNPLLDVMGSNGNLVLDGKLQVTAGTVTFGDGFNNNGAASEGLTLRAGSELTVDGGTINTSGYLAANSHTITFNMSNGGINVNTVGNAGAQTFIMSSTDNTINITGGMINILQSNGNTNRDYYVRGTNPVINGSSIAFGGMMNPALNTFDVEGHVPFMIIYPSQEVKLGDNITSGGFSLNTGAILNLNQKDLYFTGEYLANSNGTINSVGSTMHFQGTVMQEVDGSIELDNVTINNAQGVKLKAGSNLTVNNTLSMTNGLLETGTNKVILGPTATITGETDNSYVSGFLESTRMVDTENKTVDFGGIGFELTPKTGSTDFPETTTVIRETGTNAAKTINCQACDLEDVGSSLARNFDVTVSNTSKNGQFNLGVKMTYLNVDNMGSALDVNDMAFYKESAGVWSYVGVANIESAVGTSTTVALAPSYSITGFSNVTAGKGSTNNPAPLPVEFLSFTANNTGEQVVLDWKTASEKDNDHFVIEAATGSATEFVEIGKVYSKVQNSTIVQSYSFSDFAKLTGTRYYRLKQVDTDGTFAYSKVVSVQSGNGIQVAAMPNPFVNAVAVNVQASEAGKAAIMLTNLTGQVIWNKTVSLEKGVNTIQVENTNNLPSGVYILTTQINGQVNIQKLVRQ